MGSETESPARFTFGFQQVTDVTDPTPITSRLAAADRLVQQERGGGLLLRALPWLFAALVVAFVLDVFLHLGPVARLLLIAGWVVGGLSGWYAHSRDVPLTIELLPHGFAVGFKTRF